MQDHSTLKSHKREKKKLITPMNQLNLDLSSWAEEGLPHYYWLGAIVELKGKDQGIKDCIELFGFIKNIDANFLFPSFDYILKMDLSAQNILFKKIIDMGLFDALSPLTIIYTYSDYPVFSTLFYSDISIEDRIDKITSIIDEMYDHQSYLTTDVKYLICVSLVMSGNVHVPSGSEIPKAMEEYCLLPHDAEPMKKYRSIVRALEGGMRHMSDIDESQAKSFWDKVSKMSECSKIVIQVEQKNHVDPKIFEERLHYYYDLFLSTQPLDEKMDVILGISTYSYKIYKELVDHDLFEAIAGRHIIRTLVENLIMVKYLLLKEKESSDVWTKYKYYGIGKYKLIEKRYEEEYPNDDTHVNWRYLSDIVNEFRNEEFIDINLGGFEDNIRKKAESASLLDLYNKYYDYDSSFSHCLWGAVRESSMLKCVSPGHKYHCVPDLYDEQKQSDVGEDCSSMMDMIIKVLDEEYGR